MRKLFLILFIGLGITIIGIGIFLQLNTSKDEQLQTYQEEINKTEPFTRLNTFNLEEICPTYSPINTYIETVTFTNVNFSYPNCVHEYNLNESYKYLKNEESTFSITTSKEKETIKNFMNEQKTKIIAYKNNSQYQDVTYSEIVNLTTENDVEVSYIEFNYQFGITKYDVWHIAVKIDDTYILTFELSANNKIIPYKIIEELINTLELEEKTSKFTNSTIEGEYQIGSLKQNFNNSYEHGIKLNYKVPTSLPEVESITTNYDQSSFGYEDINKKFFVTISLTKPITYKTLQEEIESYSKSVGKSFEGNPDTYRNNKNTEIIQKNINGKDIYYFIYSYDYYLENKKTSSHETAYVYYQIADKFFYKIYISNKNYPITEEFISQFLNFTVEEY